MTDSANRDALDARSPGRQFPPPAIWLLVTICMGLIAWLRATEKPDPAIANIATLVLAFVAAAATFCWFAVFSVYSRTFRWSTLLALALLVAGAAACFRIDQVDGNLAPHFVPRWAPRHHEQLAELPVVGDSPAPAAIQVSTSPPGARDFPQFLGPERRNMVTGVRLARDWSAHPPKLLWRQPIGDGWSAFSVVGGLAVTQEQRGGDEFVSCYELLTGKVRWAASNPALHAEALGGVGPRATPTILAGRVYTLGATGCLQCLDLDSGRRRWRQELYSLAGISQAEDEAEVAWGRANSPLAVDGRVVIPIGGKPNAGPRSLAAFDAESGSLIWRVGERQISYSSPSLVTLAGVRQLTIVNENSVAGHDFETGALLWEFEWEGKSSANATASQAAAVGDDRLLVSKGYGVGAALFRIALVNGGWTVSNLWQSRRVLKTKFSNVAVCDGYVYGLSEDHLECVDLEHGERVWRGARYGKGQLLLVDDLLLIQAENGDVALALADSREFRELGRFAAIEGVCWNNACLAGKYLLVRNAREAACYELPLED